MCLSIPLALYVRVAIPVFVCVVSCDAARNSVLSVVLAGSWSRLASRVSTDVFDF